MNETTRFFIDGRPATAGPGETVWQAAHRLGLEIPHLCLASEPDFRPDGNCRLCMVEVEGRDGLSASCATRPEPGMRVHTGSERAAAARRMVMELLLAEAAVHAGSDCARWAAELGVTASRLPRDPERPAPDPSHPGIAVDLAACIRCARCVQACREVELYDVIGMARRGAATLVAFDLDDPMGDSSCVSCGSCAQTCPTGALAFRRLP